MVVLGGFITMCVCSLNVSVSLTGKQNLTKMPRDKVGILFCVHHGVLEMLYACAAFSYCRFSLLLY